MKKFLFSAIVSLTLNHVFAQWNGSTTSSGDIYRDGNVGILNAGTGTVRGIFDVAKDGDIYLSSAINGGSGQSLFLPGHIFMAPFGASNIVYLQARRLNDAGTTELRLRTSNNGSLTEAMEITGEGNVGIGIVSPISKLHIQGANLGNNMGDRIRHVTFQNGCGTGGNTSYIDVYSYRNASGDNWFTASSRIQQTIDGSPMGFLEFNPPNMRNGLSLGTNNQAQLYINDAGQVGIGTNDTKGYRLAVNGNAIFESIKVKLNANWPDYVFHKSYSLLPLPEVEKFILQNNHLPEVPSATEVAKNGLDVGDNQAILLKKIEELTLYLIEQDKQIKKLAEENKELAELKKEVKALQAIILTK